MIYKAFSKGGYKVAGVHDPQSIRNIGIIFRPIPWITDTVYYLRSEDDYDIVVPSLPNGYYYKVANAGVSGALEPTWATVAGELTTDGTVAWEAVSYNLLDPDVNIVDSSWELSDDVVIANDSFTEGTTLCTITECPLTEGDYFTLTNHVTYSNEEEEDVTLRFKIGSR